MNENEQKREEREVSKRQERIEHLAEDLVEAVEINAWEYGNNGDFLFYL